MVKIRLSRSGAKKRPFYHIVVSDARSSRGGHYIERLGLYNPVATGNEEKLRIDREKIDAWIQKGAQPTEVVSKLLKAASA